MPSAPFEAQEDKIPVLLTMYLGLGHSRDAWNTAYYVYLGREISEMRGNFSSSKLNNSQANSDSCAIQSTLIDAAPRT
jgi:hypothetical protein